MDISSFCKKKTTFLNSYKYSYVYRKTNDIKSTFDKKKTNPLNIISLIKLNFFKARLDKQSFIASFKKQFGTI